QVGDTGVIKLDDGLFVVKDTQKAGKGILHLGQLELGTLEVGESVTAAVDASRRQATALNHSVTHLMHDCLRKLLGDHVTQKGSLVGPDRLRFDFSHLEAMTADEIREIEDMVNKEIRANHEVSTRLMDLDSAKEAGAMALFGEKYDDEVRVVSMGDASTELCGGTHVQRTGDIGLFKILSESGIAAGVRRIEAVTGEAALAYLHQLNQELAQTAGLVKGDVFAVSDKVRQVLDRSRQLEKEIEQLKAKLTAHAGTALLEQVIEVNGTKVLVANLEGVDSKSLRGSLDDLKNKLQSGIVVLATVTDDKVSLIAGVTKDLTGKVKAGELVNLVAQQVGGKGGGRPDMAQAGGTEPAQLPAALASVTPWLTERL
ncbi:MAG: DHHA1 domain-containing protein, partial [Oceanisphaera sp.]|nr:DHHA1 domain-containing protein [Oceanisphaera sp.]